MGRYVRFFSSEKYIGFLGENTWHYMLHGLAGPDILPRYFAASPARWDSRTQGWMVLWPRAPGKERNHSGRLGKHFCYKNNRTFYLKIYPTISP